MSAASGEHASVEAGVCDLIAYRRDVDEIGVEENGRQAHRAICVRVLDPRKVSEFGFDSGRAFIAMHAVGPDVYSIHVCSFHRAWIAGANVM